MPVCRFSCGRFWPKWHDWTSALYLHFHASEKSTCTMTVLSLQFYIMLLYSLDWFWTSTHVVVSLFSLSSYSLMSSANVPLCFTSLVLWGYPSAVWSWTCSHCCHSTLVNSCCGVGRVCLWRHGVQECRRHASHHLCIFKVLACLSIWWFWCWDIKWT